MVNLNKMLWKGRFERSHKWLRITWRDKKWNTLDSWIPSKKVDFQMKWIMLKLVSKSAINSMLWTNCLKLVSSRTHQSVTSFFSEFTGFGQEILNSIERIEVSFKNAYRRDSCILPVTSCQYKQSYLCQRCCGYTISPFHQRKHF